MAYGGVRMDIMELFRRVCNLFVKYFSITFTVGGYKISVASVYVFCGLVLLVVFLLRRFS